MHCAQASIASSGARTVEDADGAPDVAPPAPGSRGPCVGVHAATAPSRHTAARADATRRRRPRAVGWREGAHGGSPRRGRADRPSPPRRRFGQRWLPARAGPALTLAEHDGTDAARTAHVRAGTEVCGAGARGRGRRGDGRRPGPRPAPGRLRRRRRHGRRHGPRARDAQPVRRGAARPRPARACTGTTCAARCSRPGRRPGSSCSPLPAGCRRRSTGSGSARTTTWPSRSRSRSCSPACRPWPAARRRRSRPSSRRPASGWTSHGGP